MEPLADFPEEFLHRLRRIVPPQRWERVSASLTAREATAFRVNTLKGSIDSVVAELTAAGIQCRPVAWYGEAFSVPDGQRRALTTSAAAVEHRIYIQNLSSMLAPLLLAPRAGEQVLDLAAAPGGKSLQMAALMGNDGWISAVEVVKGRFHRLKGNVIAHGAHCVHTYHKDGTRVWRLVEGRFDRVLLDAPCSSESRIRRDDPASYAYWSEKKIREAQRKQRKLIDSALRSLKPGGLLLYSTCSYAPEENEAVVQWALERWPELVVVGPERPADFRVAGWLRGRGAWEGACFDGRLARARRILPADDGPHTLEGFFLCLLRKGAGG